MRTTRKARVLFALCALGLTFAAVTATSASAAADIYLKLQGIAETSGSAVSIPNCAILDAAACPMGASGTISCEFCRAGAPTSGAFSFSVETLTTVPPNPCRVKSLTGVFLITWSDSTTSTVSFSGRFREGKPILALAGTVTASSNPYVATASAAKADLNGFPASPCVSSSSAVTGTLTFS